MPVIPGWLTSTSPFYPILIGAGFKPTSAGPERPGPSDLGAAVAIATLGGLAFLVLAGSHRS